MRLGPFIRIRMEPRASTRRGKAPGATRPQRRPGSPRAQTLFRIPVALSAVLLATVALSALGQTTRPAPEDGYGDIPIPTRRAATTQGTPGAASSIGSTDVFETKRLAIALAIVIAAIFISHRVWKRLGMPGVMGRASGSLQLVSRLNVSPKQQLLLIRVGRRLVLVGNSGAQMNPLCEIADPEEAAAILGQVSSEREQSTADTFGAVLGSEEKRFEEAENAANTDPEPQPNEQDAALASTREELSGMMDKVRDLSRQFRRA